MTGCEIAHLLVFDRGAGLGAEIRKLELIGEPIDDVVNLEFEQQLEIATVLAAPSRVSKLNPTYKTTKT